MIEKEQAPERKRQIGHYVVQERTAKRLVLDTRQRPLIAVGVMWAILVPLAILALPWRGGARLFVVATAALILLVISLLAVYFTPARRQVVVDMGESAVQVTRRYLFPPRSPVLEIPLRTVTGVRRHRQVWNDPGEIERVEWSVELVGEEGASWVLVEQLEKEVADEIARLVAEITGRPLEDRS